jgi:hypothetical protein
MASAGVRLGALFAVAAALQGCISLRSEGVNGEPAEFEYSDVRERNWFLGVGALQAITGLWLTGEDDEKHRLHFRQETIDAVRDGH